MTDGADPGWWPAIRGLPGALIPFADLSRLRGPRQLDLVRLHLSMAASLVLFVVAFSFIEIDKDSSHEAWGWLAVGATTAIAVFDIRSTGRRMSVAPPDERAAVRKWGALYLIRVGMAMTPALAGFAMSFLGAGRAPYIAGVAISEFLLWLVAPTRRNLERLSDGYRIQGRDIDLTRALVRDPGRPDTAE